MGRLRVGVLASGAGSLFQAILDGRDESYDVVVFGTDREASGAMERARNAGLPARALPFREFASREEFSAAIGRWLAEHDVGLAVHAGFMRILSPSYFEAVGAPALNSHPALLPSFPGAHGVRDALEHGVKVTGTTIHFATEEFDTGPIIAQEAVAVLPGDTEESLHERIKVVEQRLYPEVIRWFAQGRLKIEGRRVHIL